MVFAGRNAPIGGCIMQLEGKPVTRNETSDDSQANTIIHELSHIALFTFDFEYGVDDSQELARSAPYLALLNADNWGYAAGV